MSILGRIAALRGKIDPDIPPTMVAVFDDGHREDVPPEMDTIAWVIGKAMEPTGPRITHFECAEDPAAAREETLFLRCFPNGGDLSHLWDDYGKEEVEPTQDTVEFDGLGLS